MILPKQWREGRALLDWSQSDLAKQNDSPASLVMRLETEYTLAPYDVLAMRQVKEPPP